MLARGGAPGLLLSLFAFAFIADAGEPVLESAASCSRILTDSERLRCFDALFRPEADSPVTSSSAEQEFGLTEAERDERRRETGSPVVARQVTTKLLRLVSRNPEPPLLDLENGQQWRLLEVSDVMSFRAGETIIIRRGALGSYFASTPGRNGAWRVRRVQ